MENSADIVSQKLNISDSRKLLSSCFEILELEQNEVQDLSEKCLKIDSNSLIRNNVSLEILSSLLYKFTAKQLEQDLCKQKLPDLLLCCCRNMSEFDDNDGEKEKYENFMKSLEKLLKTHPKVNLDFECLEGDDFKSIIKAINFNSIEHFWKSITYVLILIVFKIPNSLGPP